MAFALTAFEAFPLMVQGAQPRRAVQRVVFHATGTTGDVDFDIGDFTGTFWTAAITTDLGVTALAAIQKIIAQVDYRVGLYSPEIDDLTRAAVPSPTEYILAFENQLPKYTLFAGGGGLLAYHVTVDFHLDPNMLSEVLTLGITGV